MGTTEEGLSRYTTTTTMATLDHFTFRTPTVSYTAPRMPSNLHSGSGQPLRVTSQACTVSLLRTASDSVTSPTLSMEASNAEATEIAQRQRTERVIIKLSAQCSAIKLRLSRDAPILHHIEQLNCSNVTLYN